jgi:hypothetical protein
LRRRFKLAKVKRKHQPIILSACLLLAGCNSNPQTIRFSDDNLQRPADPITDVAADSKKLGKADLLKVELAIYADLLQRHFWDDGGYSAVFVQGTDDEVAALIKEFPKHVPPIKTSDRAQLLPNRTPVDKDTGQPAMILSVDALDPEGDTVLAIGKWYAGGAVSGFYTFALKKAGDDWVIESSK